MKENSPQDQSPLKVSVDEAIERLSKSKNRGDKLIIEIRKLQDSKDVNDNLYGEISSGSENFIRDIHTKISKIYKSEIYIKAFRLNERFSYEPRQNIEDFRKWSIQEHQKPMSDKELDFQWNFHRKGTIDNLRTILEYKVEYLSERIQYLKKYGSDLRFILLEEYIIKPIQALSTIANQSSLLGIDMRGNGASYLIFGIAGISREHTKYPVFDVNPHFIGEGGEWYTALFNLLIELKNEFEDRFHEVFKFGPIEVNQDWIGGPPKYSNLNLESCCEELSNYISEFIKNVLALPPILRRYLDKLQNERGRRAETPGKSLAPDQLPDKKDVDEIDEVAKSPPESIGAENIIMRSSTGFVIRYQGGDDLPFGDLDGLFYIWACLDHPMKTISERELTEKRIGRSQDQSESRIPDTVKPYEKEYLENISGGGVIDPEGIQKTIQTYTTAIVNMEADKKKALEENNNVEADSLERDIKKIKAERAKLRNKYDRPISEIDDPDDSRRIIYAALDYVYKKMESNQPELAAHLRKHLIRERGLHYTGNLEWETR